MLRPFGEVFTIMPTILEALLDFVIPTCQTQSSQLVLSTHHTPTALFAHLYSFKVRSSVLNSPDIFYIRRHVTKQ